jgi:hypothetical protein
MGMVAWTPPVDIATVAPIVRSFVAAPGPSAGWIEGQRTFARVQAGGQVRRTELKRPWRAAGFDARGRALTVTSVTSRRPCRGKRPYRLYIEVRRDGAPTQRVGDGCRNIGGAELTVNPSGRALLAWLEIPGPGAKKRLVVAEGSTTSPMRAVLNSGRGDASGHAVALNARGDGIVAFRRGSRMLVRIRRAGRRFGAAQDLGATPQRDSPATAVALDEEGNPTVAWTDKCACGEAGMTRAPNPLRVWSGSGEPVVLDPGKGIVGPPQVAPGTVAWGTEDGPEGTSVSVAPYANGMHFPREGGLLIGGDVPMLVSPTTAHRYVDGAWTSEAVGASGFARALFTDTDGRPALVTQDGDRLRISYRR